MDQIAVVPEGRHLLADRFLRFGSNLMNRHPEFIQDRLNLYWKPDDIVVDGFGSGGSRSQVVDSPEIRSSFDHRGIDSSDWPVTAGLG